MTSDARSSWPRGIGLRRDRWLLLAVAVLLGILAVGQFRGQSGLPGLSDLSVADLGVLVANLNAQNDELRAEVASLERQRSDLATANARGQSAVDQLRADLSKTRAWAGLAGLTGAGVTITVQGSIGADGVQDIVNELRNAGAEGIAIADVRLVPGVVVAGSAGALMIDEAPLGGTFQIRAIGSPQILTGTLTRSEGLILPPTSRDLQPADAEPHL
jgi:uncharacterized protein YlxW (UPF0749 family)